MFYKTLKLKLKKKTSNNLKLRKLTDILHFPMDKVVLKKNGHIYL